MKWTNVKLIFIRELKDQLRDRRTLFTVAVLPLVLYPLMGMALLQVAQFMREHPTKIWIVGSENLPGDPALIVDGKIDSQWLNPGEQELLDLQMSQQDDRKFYELIAQFKEQSSQHPGGQLVDQLVQREMQTRSIDLAVFVPHTMHLNSKRTRDPPEQDDQKTSIYIFLNSASDKSNIAAQRFNSLLSKWQDALVQKVLKENNLAVSMVQPFVVARADVADRQGKRAAAWSKILPFVVMIWSLTGAFYPAVDLVAGEKERGTFETLLSSPAARSEIAIGKLMTVMTFSIVTSLLNLLSMGFTGMFVVAHMGGVGLGNSVVPLDGPPTGSIGWLLLALVPISALFSAVALAAAAFARSSKEGQYYLLPLMMISMPLMMVPMLPAAKLDLGTSLIPVSGLMLMLRGLIEGQYAESARFAGPVCMVTLVCCYLSIRWVVKQFNSETVLFRASEQFAIGTWFRHVMRQRHELPSLGSAVLLGIMILVIKFFVGFAMQSPESWTQFAKQTVVVLIATVGTPALLMAIVLTRNPRKSLRLRLCSLPVASASILLAICLHPMVMWFSAVVMHLYPPTGDLMQVQKVVTAVLNDAPGLWAILLIFALVPAVIEELAFRGFILSGMQSLRNRWQSIILTSLLFGMAHAVIQQTIITFVVGMVLGFIAVQTRSIIPCILFHATHNGLSVLVSMIKSSSVTHSPMLGWFVHTADGVNYQYSLMPAILMSLTGALLIAWFWRLDVSNDDGPSLLMKKFSLDRVVAKLVATRKAE